MSNYPRARNGYMDTGAPLIENRVKTLRCPKCNSTNYTETISMESCRDCGLKCDYWGGGANEVYQEFLDTKHAIEKRDEEEKFRREIREEHEAQFNNDHSDGDW